jgi:cysteine-rich repeat protein
MSDRKLSVETHVPPRKNGGRIISAIVAVWLCIGVAGVVKGVCPATVAPAADPTGVRQNRYISFTPGNAGVVSAIRVTLVDLYHPVPANPPGGGQPNFTTFDTTPNTVCVGGSHAGHHCDTDADCRVCTRGTILFKQCTSDADCPLGGPGSCPAGGTCPAANKVACTAPGGCVRWVGPPTDFPDEPPVGVTFKAAALQCTPHYQDWGGVGLLRVYGPETLPSSAYDVQHIALGCDEGMEADYSAPLAVNTARWADVVAPFNPPSTFVQPDAVDLAYMVNKWQGRVGALGKWQMQLGPNVPDPTKRIDTMDIALAVDAFKLFAYSLRGPIVCPYPPSCPDGVVDRGEECDDGNSVNGDGCNASCRAETRTAIVSLVPVLPYGTSAEPYFPGTVIQGNNIFFPLGGERVWLELRFSGWNPDLNGTPRLATWQVQIDADGFMSGDAATLALAVQPCVVNTDCTAAFGPDSRCGFSTPGRCDPGFMDDTHPGGLPDDGVWSFEMSMPDVRFGSPGVPTGVVDPGTSVYAATLVLDIPDEARGRFTIGFDPSLLNTYIFDSSSPVRVPIPITLQPAVITVVGKNRFLTVSHPPTVPGGPWGPLTALRVRMIDLQNPDPPNAPNHPPKDFSAFESATCTAEGETQGCARWVGPPATFLEAQDSPDLGSFRAARLQCTPYYHDWANEGRFHVTGAEIIPSSFYDLETLASTCMGIEDTCADVSDPVRLFTARWGDVTPQYAPPALTSQPDGLDVTQLVNRFKNVPEIPSKAVTQLQPNLPELNGDINGLDIVAVVDAAEGFAYPYGGPCPCPSLVTCGRTTPPAGTPCTSPTVCVTAFGAGAMCVKTCAGGANAGDSCINNTHCPGSTCGNPFCRDKCGRCSP